MTDRRRYIYRVKALTRPVDGDTWDFTVVAPEPYDFGFGTIVPIEETHRFRLNGIDVVERGSPLGPAAKQFAEGWIRLALADDVLEGESFKHDTTTPDASFGRWLIDLWRIDNRESLVDALRASGFEKRTS